MRCPRIKQSLSTVTNMKLVTNIIITNTAPMGMNMLATNRIRITNSVGVAQPLA